MSKGKVKWFDATKGYGFIEPEDGSKDLFVHHSQIKKMDNEFAKLDDGQEVEYVVADGPKGPCANNVTSR